jgi:hypothetical protein
VPNIQASKYRLRLSSAANAHRDKRAPSFGFTASFAFTTQSTANKIFSSAMPFKLLKGEENMYHKAKGKLRLFKEMAHRSN